MELFDAVISGAGPAGCVLAHTLAGAGMHVLLLEKGPRGRERVCGGFLGPETAGIWKEIGWERAFEDLPKNPISEVLVSGPDARKNFTNRFTGDGAWSVDRGPFDEWLAQQAVSAGVEVRYSVEVAEAARTNGCWRLKTASSGGGVDIGARHYFVATGRRKPAFPNASKTFFACRTAYEGADTPPERVSLHFVRRGHVGLNPLDARRTALCLYVEGKRLKEAKGDLDAMMRRFFLENASLARDLGAARRVADWHTCAAEPDSMRLFYKNGIFFVGDAVTMVQPIVGGGMPIAMASALLLGRLIAAGAKSGQTGERIARRYRREWEKLFLRRVRVAAMLGFVERSDLLARYAFTIMDRVPGVFAPMVSATRPS